MNKKGFTLVEIIVSISLISIVVIFLFQIIITIKNLNDNEVNKTNNQMAVAIITREVEKDLNSFGLEQDPSTTCDTTQTNIIPSTAENIKCIKLTYRNINVKNNEGYIIYYKNKNSNKYFLAYKRGKDNIIETQTVREVTITENNNLEIQINKEITDDMYSLRLVVPIRSNQYKYDLIISYIDTVEVSKNAVNIYVEGGELIEKIGEGEYKKGTSVTVKYLYDTTKYLLDDVSCTNTTCENNGTTISFTMPDKNVSIKITLKKKTIYNYLLYLYQTKTNSSLEMDDTSDHNLRYVGYNASNSISFNGELWRIIGIFNVYNTETRSYEKLAKITKNDFLGLYSWDSSDSSINNGKGINEWNQADLMKELNTDYIDTSKTSGTTYWYNGYNNQKEGVYDYSKNIKSAYIDKIASVRWNLGGITFGTSANTYIQERGTNHISNPADGITRKNFWDGKIGLLYPSDYSYASTDQNCRNELSNCGGYSTWLYSSNYQWTITSYTYTAFNVSTITPSSNGTFTMNTSADYNLVRPALYLKSDVLITGGEGYPISPYTIN